MKFKSRMFPISSYRKNMMKTAIAQVTYGPIATPAFFMLMNLMERKTIDESMDNVQQKLWPTMKFGAIYWMFTQPFCFLFLRMNRGSLVSIFELIWAAYLSQMHQEKIQKEKKFILLLVFVKKD